MDKSNLQHPQLKEIYVNRKEKQVKMLEIT